MLDPLHRVCLFFWSKAGVVGVLADSTQIATVACKSVMESKKLVCRRAILQGAQQI